MEKTVSSTVEVQRPVLRHKMYKSGKSWVVAGVMGVATGTLMLTATASADTVSGSATPEASTTPAATQTVATTTMAATTEATPAANANQLAESKVATTTAVAGQSISQPIKVDSSALSNAVSAASQVGLNPTYDSSAAKSYVSSNDSQTASYASQIKSDYASQATNINRATKQYLHNKSTYNTYNESQGNHSALDAAASAAAQVPGLTVTKNQDKVTSGVDVSDDSAISNWSSSTAADYASQVEAINKAVDAQKQENSAANSANAAINAEIDKVKAVGVAVKKTGNQTADSKSIEADKNNQLQQMAKIADRLNKLKATNSLSTQELIQNLDLGEEDNANLTVDGKNTVKGDPVAGADNNRLSTYSITVNPENNSNEVTTTATYTNLSKSSYTDSNGVLHKIAKIVVKYHAYNKTASYDGTPYLQINQQPQEGFWYFGFNKVDAEYTFYDENGNTITIGKNAWLTVSSLNNGGPDGDFKTGDTIPGGQGYRQESVNGDGTVHFRTLDGSTVVAHDDGWTFSDVGNDKIRVGYGRKEGKFALLSGDNLTKLYEVTRNGNSWVVGNLIAEDANGISPQDVWNSGYEEWDEATNDSRYAGATVGDIKEGSTTFKLSFATNYYGANNGGTWAMVSTIIPPTPAVQYHLYSPSTSSVSYHYNKLKMANNPTLNKPKIAYHYDTLTQTTTPDKNWTQGDQKVNGKTEVNDDTVSATVKMDYQKPQNLVGGLTKLSLSDNYAKMADNVTYQGAQVYENNALATSLYSIANDATDATVTATRKDASTAPGGTVSLVVDFKVKGNVPSGTKLVNSGSGTINNSTVPTKNVQIVTYQQTADKHWIEGTQTVDGKTYINDDVVTTKVDMSLPDPSTLAHSLTNVTVDDNYSDFADKVKLQSYRVEENGKNVTNQYSVTTTNGHLTAVRKDASSAPQGKVSLIATWQINSNVPSGTTFTNRGSGRINNHTVDTNTPSIKTYTQTADKHWVEGGQTVDDKTYINDDVIHGRVEMSLPNKSDLAKPLTDVTLTDDYTDYANNVTYQSAQVLENGKDVTGEYTIANANGKVVATRKTPGSAPSGNVQLIANFKIKDSIPSGTTFTNRGSGRINNHTVNTNNAKVVTYQQTTDKHWMSGTQVVDGKTYVDGDTVNGQVSMSLPNPTKLAKPLSKVQIVDDYSNFKDKADYVSAKVYENGVNATDKYTITNDSKTGTVTAVRKDASTAPQGTVVLSANWKVHQNVASGTKLVNGGSGTINDSTVKTPDRTIVTYSQETTKNWIEGKTVVNGKTYIDNDDITAQVTVKMPDRDNLAEKLTNVVIKDDYSNFKDKAKVQSVAVYENGKNVTSQYDIKNDASTGLVTATRLDPKSAPSGTIQMNVVWKINSDVASGTTFKNTPISTLNNHDVTGTPVTITGYKPTTDKNFVEGSQVVNDKTYIDSDVINAKIDMSLPDPSTLAKPLSKVELVDDYGQMARYVSAPTSVQVIENGKDVTSEYTIATANGKVTATRKDPSKAPAGSVSLLAKFKINADTPSGTQLVNAGSGTLNNETVPTPSPKVETYKPSTDKHWTEGSQDVDGKVYVSGDQTQADVTMTLPDPSKLAKKLSKVQVVDDYTNFKDKVDFVSATVYENGKNVTDQYAISHDNGRVVATRKDASTTPQGTVDLHTVFKLHSDVADKTVFVNNGSGAINDETIATPSRTVTIFKQTADKHWVEGDQVVDGKTFISGDKVTGQVSMSLPNPTTLAKPLSKVQIVDDYTNFKDKVDFVSATVYENDQDVTSEYTITDANGKVTAVRKDASKAPFGSAKLVVSWKVHQDVASGTKLINAGSGTINGSTVKTPDRTIVTYSQETTKNWIEGNTVVNGKTYIDNDDITAQVTVKMPDRDNLAEKLTNVVIKDDYSNFKDKAKVQSIKVYENGQDATSQYDIKNDASTGLVTATRLDPKSAPSGTIQMNVVWKINSDVASGTTFKNTPISTLNNHDVTGTPVTITGYKPTTDKNFVEGSQVVNDKTYIDSDVINAKIDMSLPDPSTLAKPLSKVELVDDYGQMARYVSAPTSVQVLENGKDVTSEYTIATANGKVTATRKDPSTAPAGSVSLLAKFKVNADTPSGTQLINAGSGTLNNETVPTPSPKVETYKQTTDKHWTEGSQDVDGKVYVSGDQTQADVTMTLPDPAKLAKKLSKVQVVDDYTNFKDKVDFVSATVYENGKNVTDQYAISHDNGRVVATRKDASKTPQGTVDLHTVFKLHSDVANKTVFINNGSGTINDETIATPSRTVTTFKQTTDKHWTEGSQVVDDKTYIADDMVNAEISTNLPNPSTLAKKLTKVQLTDNYTNFKDNVDYVSATVYENDADVTSLYTITNANGKVVAVRKDPANTPAGTAKLDVKFKIHDDVKSGTIFKNTGDVLINDSDVSTPSPKIVTYKQTADKHWVEGDQVVDGKTFISGDKVTGQVSMSLPDKNQLAKPLSKVELVDDYTNFKDKADYVSARVYENDQDVTSEYTITDANGKVTAVRKDASKTPSGSAKLVVSWQVHQDVASGTKLINAGSGTINGSTVKTPDRTIVTYSQETTKNWIEGNTVVNGKTYIDNDDITAQVTVKMPDRDNLAEKLTNVVIKDDYSNFKDKAKVQSIKVYENGQDATSQYDIKNYASTGLVTATRLDPKSAPSGTIQMNVVWKINSDVASGTTFKNTPISTLNNHDVTGTPVTVTGYKPKTDKNFVEGSQVVNDKTYIDSDVINAKIDMSLPDPSTLAKPLSKVELVDDYGQMARYVSAPTSVQVIENGKDVTSEYTIATANGKVVATRKDPSKAPAGSVSLLAKFKVNADTPSGTQLINAGSGTLNNETVPTPSPKVETYKQTTDKHWTEGSQDVDGKVYVSGDQTQADVTMTLPDPAKLAKKLSKVQVVDDYTNFKDKVDFVSATVYENGKNVTDQYTITHDNGKVVATRNNASTTPQGTVDLHTIFKLHSDVADKTIFVNNGSGTINDETITTPSRTVTIFKQATDKHWTEGSQVVDDKTYIADDTVNAEISTNLPDPSTLAKKLTKVQLTDNFTNFKDNVDYVSATVYENNADVTSLYTITNANGKVVAVRKDPANTPAGTAKLDVKFKIHDDVKSGTIFKNTGDVLINDSDVSTPSPKIVTYKQTADKHWVEGDQVVDGKTFISGDKVTGEVSMSLPDKDQLAKPLSKVELVDDYSNFKDKADYVSARVYEGNQDVTDQYTITDANGKVTAVRKDASKTPSGSAKLVVSWQVHTDVASGTKLINAGSGTINGSTVKTPDRTIVTYKQDTDKHWMNNGQVVDGKVAINGDTVTAQVDMTLPKGTDLGGSINKVQLVDDFSKFAKDVDVAAVHVYENGIDVTSEYNISINPNGQVVATRKDPSKVDLTGGVSMMTEMKANKMLNASNVVMNATAKVNDDKATTQAAAVSTPLAPSSSISVANGQIKSQVNVNVPSGTNVKNFAIADDYSNFSNAADASKAKVYENGVDATDQYTITDKDGKVVAVRKTTDGMSSGSVSMTIDYKLKHDIANGTVLENHGSGTLNGETVETNTPSITTYTQSADKHWVEGDQVVDGKIYADGSTATAKVTTTLPDPATLTAPLTDVTLTDDYSAFADKVDLTNVQVLENGADATNEYTITKENGKIVAVRKDASKAPAGNAQLITTFKIHADVENGTQLVNTGSSTINKHTVSTNTAVITTFKPNPTKDAVVSVDNNTSLSNIPLNTEFDYKLVGSTLPKNSAGITEYGFADDYDQEHDQYNGGYTVLLSGDVTLTDGTTLKKGTDVTKYTTQVIDQDNGKVTIEFDKDFLTKVDFTKSEFGATAYLKMKRVKAGDVENSYDNTVNGESFKSNTIKTHTNEPKPETPKTETPKTETPKTETPKTETPKSTTPVTPVSTPLQSTAQPQMAAMATPALAQPQQKSEQQALPQTGNAKDEREALLGAAILGIVGATMIPVRRKRYGV